MRGIRTRIEERVPRSRAAALRMAAALVVLGLAAAVRLHRLDARGVHWDEGVHAYYSWEFLTSGEFAYEPWRHGPFLYYVSAPLMRVAGESVLTGRTAVALLSLGMFPALYLLREELPTPALAFSALVLALHPYVVLTARFYRNDVLLATFGLLAVGCYARYYRTGAPLWALGIGLAAGLAFASKEVAFLVLPAVAAATLVVVHFHARFATGSIRSTVAEFLPLRYLPLTALGFGGVIAFFFGGWPPDPAAGPGAFVDGLTFWLSEGRAESGRVTYYLEWLAAGTPVLFALAVVGVAGTVLRPDSSWFRWLFLAWAGFVTLVQSLIGDQSWWNVVTLFAPVALLAGYGVADVCHGASALVSAGGNRLDARTTRWSPLGFHAFPWGRVLSGVALPLVGVAVVLAVVTGAASTPAAVAGLDHPNRTTELGVQGVTVPDRPTERDRAFGAAREAALETDCPGLIGSGVYRWPATWWFRGIEHARVDEIRSGGLPAVVVTRSTHPGLDDRGYRVETFGDHRVYVPDRCE